MVLLPRCWQRGRSALSRRGGEHRPEPWGRAVAALRTRAEHHASPPIEVDLARTAAECRTWLRRCGLRLLALPRRQAPTRRESLQRAQDLIGGRLPLQSLPQRAFGLLQAPFRSDSAPSRPSQPPARPGSRDVKRHSETAQWPKPRPDVGLLWAALLRRPLMSPLQRPLSGAKRTSAGGRPPAPSARQNSSGQDDPKRREPRASPRRRPDGVRRGPVRGPAPTPYSHTPPRAGTRRHAALPMTLVDAHRAARRDSPVLPVRIFPVGSRDPIRGERPSSADATETPWSCQDRGYRLGAEGARRRSAGRCG